MAKYIDREKLYAKLDDTLGEISKNKHTQSGFVSGFMYCMSYIDNNLDEDVISVVRCRNCQYHHWEQEPSHGKAAHFCNLLKREVNKDFYCASGSLKD